MKSRRKLSTSHGLQLSVPSEQVSFFFFFLIKFFSDSIFTMLFYPKFFNWCCVGDQETADSLESNASLFFYLMADHLHLFQFLLNVRSRYQCFKFLANKIIHD